MPVLVNDCKLLKSFLTEASSSLKRSFLSFVLPKASVSSLIRSFVDSKRAESVPKFFFSSERSSADES